MNLPEYDVIVLGGGPGGYVAAIKAAQKGLKVALVEAKQMGGTCLNRGCIPSKTLIGFADKYCKIKKAEQYGIHVKDVSFDYAYMFRKKNSIVDGIRKGLEGLIASNQIDSIKGFGKFISPNEIKVEGEKEALLKGKNIIIATGSESRELPLAPFDHQTILDSTSLLDLQALPKSLIIIGGGIIGCEFACLHAELGVDVTIIEMLPMIISPEGKQISETLHAALKKKGVKIEVNATLTKVEKQEKNVVAYLQDGRTFSAEKMLVSVGRKLNSDNIGIENAGVKVEKNGSIPIDETMRTNVAHIYAIGDVTGKWLLAHYASHQGIVAVENMTGHSATINERAVPSVIYTSPEIATIGLTLEKAQEKGIDAAIGKFPFLALGKAQAVLEADGFAQIVIDKKTGEILGAQVVGYGASIMIAEIAVSITNELTAESLTATIHAHPTFSEAWMEAAFLALDSPLHLPPKRKPAAGH